LSDIFILFKFVLKSEIILKFIFSNNLGFGVMKRSLIGDFLRVGSVRKATGNCGTGVVGI
jgi:hypothetical protein